MFVPQAITAILASLLGAGLARRLGEKWMLLGGLGADLVAMALLFASQFVAGRHPLAFCVLLTATGFLGAGLGFDPISDGGYFPCNARRLGMAIPKAALLKTVHFRTTESDTGGQSFSARLLTFKRGPSKEDQPRARCILSQM